MNTQSLGVPNIMLQNHTKTNFTSTLIVIFKTCMIRMSKNLADAVCCHV